MASLSGRGSVLTLVILAPSLLSLAAAGAPSVRPAGPTAAAVEQFERSVRPVLVEHCVSCHNGKVQQGGLRLDSRAELLKGGAHGPAIVLGNPERSLLLQALRHSGLLRMPPAGKLPEPAIQAVSTWIKQGAPWPAPVPTRPKAAAGGAAAHWAFRPVTRPPLPAVKNQAWVKSPIDAFVLARLEARGLKPSPPADPRTLIRRAYFDLIGLPPTPEEVDAFVEECAREAGAGERERFDSPKPEAQHEAPDPSQHLNTRTPERPGLASPTPKTQHLAPGPAYTRLIDRLLASPRYGERWGRYWLDVARYADTKGYVFFQDGKFPWAYTYRDYVIRAFNDDLPYDRFILEQLAADQLPDLKDQRSLAAMGFLTVGGRFMNNPHDIRDDRIDVVTRGLMGLTVSCARCHDHKFDPVSTKDYYSLYGVFASSAEPIVPPSVVPDPKTEASAAYEKELQARYQKLMEYVRGKHQDVVTGARTRMAEYLVAANTLRTQPSQDDFMLLADGGDLNPVMVIRWQAYLERARANSDPVFTLWNVLADLPEKEFAEKSPALVARLLAKGPVNPRIAAAFRKDTPESLAKAAQRYSEVLNAVDREWQALVQQAGAGKAPQAMPDLAAEELRRVFYGPIAPPEVPLGHPSDLGLFPDRASQAKLQTLLTAVETWLVTGANAPPRAMALEDLPQPYEPRVFRRGNPHNLGEPVARQLPSLLARGTSRPFSRGSGRLELARAIADPKNPLTSRVLVNRVWMNHFGSPLVDTPSDFGLRSDRPTHPELLDYLAATFVGGNEELGKRGNGRDRNPISSSPRFPISPGTPWSLKALHRLLMLSNTYQQASWDRPECRKADPENRLLWRMNRRRLDFEAMRDSMLSLAGGLDLTMGGPSTDLLSGAVPARRSVYGFIDRLTLPGLLRTFDFPSPDASSAQRDTTTVPQQALYLMNHRFAQEAARRLAARPEVTAPPDLSGKVTALYRLAYGRAPEDRELRIAQQYLGESPSAAQWARFAQVLLESNELLFID